MSTAIPKGHTVTIRDDKVKRLRARYITLMVEDADPDAIDKAHAKYVAAFERARKAGEL